MAMREALQAGEMRSRVQLLRPSGSKNAVNEYVPGFTAVAIVWARVRSLRVSEAVLAGQPSGSQTLIVQVRYTPTTRAITAAYRLALGARVLVLAGPPVNIDEANHTIEMTCIEGKGLR